MKIAMISFTGNGSRLCIRLADQLSNCGYDCQGYVSEKWRDLAEGRERVSVCMESLHAWTRRQFQEADGLVFIGAAGIAVRACAEFIKDKFCDPAVVVMDERGQYAIPLLSGHVGGANELALLLAKLTGAEPVITTATDINGVFSVDVYAKKNGLVLSDQEAAKRVSADLLEGEPVGVRSDFPVEGELWKGCLEGGDCRSNIWFTVRDGQRDRSVLRLIPKLLVIGIGCRKGIRAEDIAQVVTRMMEQAGLALQSMAAVASIDLKAEEEGLVAYAASHCLPFYTYSAQELREVEGEFTGSSFVEGVTGVDNVCERAAVHCAHQLGGGRLEVKKYAEHGITAAAAVKEWKVRL